MKQITMNANRFFNPEDCPFEVLGFYEEFLDPVTFKGLGWLKLDVTEAPRPLGSPGQQERTLDADLVLNRGTKTVRIRAGTRVLTMVQILCGHVRPRNERTNS